MRHAIKSFNEYSETELLYQVSTGNREAFTELFEHYQTLVYDYSIHLTRSKSQAEEIVQDVFIKVWINREEILKIENFGAYINRSARNQSYTALRKIAAAALRLVELNDTTIPDVANSEHLLLFNESTKMLKDVVNTLPPQRKLVYELCHEKGLKYEEVAMKLNISSGTVHKHMKLALKTIRAHFLRLDAMIALLIFLKS